MKLKKLIKSCPVKEIKGSLDLEITGLSSNSKLVCPGHLFIAKKGHLDDGSRYIPEAVMSGAQAVLTDIYDPSLKEVTQLIHPDVASREGMLAAEFYAHPSLDLFMVGVTGTNGKTTTTFLIKHLLDTLKEPSGLIGTIEYYLGSHSYPATRTTPDVISNHKMLREMVSHGCKAAVMEVSSHALDQNRVEKIDFDVAIFTNLTLDHLDYHGSMEAYAASKRKLFTLLDPKNSPKKKKYKKTACLNSDSPWFKMMGEGCAAQILTYGIETPSDLQAKNMVFGSTGTHFDLLYKGTLYPAYTPLTGRFNVYNTLAGVAALTVKGFTIEAILEALKSFSKVPGRMEQVPNPLDLKILVDFAHSDDALANVLECLTELKTGKIITLFGCGGDRDRKKRPKMAAVSEAYSDLSIVTNDNPRTEAPEQIAAEIIKGFKTDRYLVELDRKKAIALAIEKAGPEDIVLIAGKGHESYQIFAHKTVEFDDRKVAYEMACKKALQAAGV